VVKVNNPAFSESKPIETREKGVCFLYCCHTLRTGWRRIFERLISKEMLQDKHGATT
jgi:hypothetical protein